jgi:hypothetical protein
MFSLFLLTAEQEQRNATTTTHKINLFIMFSSYFILVELNFPVSICWKPEKKQENISQSMLGGMMTIICLFKTKKIITDE